MRKVILAPLTQAQQQTVADNMGLVWAQARTLCNRNNVDDLAQEGAIGLGIAAQKYNPEKGIAFSTYAHAWIAKRMYDYLGDSKLIRIPHSQRELIRRKRKLEKELGYELKGKELQTALKIPDSLYRRLCASLNCAVYSEPETDKEGNTGLATIEGRKETAQINLRNMLDKTALDERERFILEFRADGLGQEEIGAALDITAARVCQLEKIACEKVRKAIAS